MEVSKLQSDEEAFHQSISRYQSVWGRNKDNKKSSEHNKPARNDTTVSGVESYYDFITNAYLAGWGEHFHFTPFAPDEPIGQSMAFFAHKLANTMGLKPGMKILDVGCGVGGPAREIAKFIGCEIVGININQGHIDQAIDRTAQSGLSHLVTFVKSDFMDMPFACESFDAAYAIEATAHAPSLPQAYANIYRILKPGGVFLTSEWVMTNNFVPSNEAHVDIRKHIERGNAVPNLPDVNHARTSLVSVGFTISHEENYAHHWVRSLCYPDAKAESSAAAPSEQSLQPGRSPVLIPFKTGMALGTPPSRPSQHLPSKPSSRPREWYYPLQGRTTLTVNTSDWWLTWKMSKVPRKTGYWLARVLENLRLYPKGVTDAMDILREAVDGLAEGGREDIFSPCWWFVCQKRVAR